MNTDDKNWPAWHYGPNGESQIFQSEDEVPAGWEDHPSKHDQAEGAESGTRTAVQPANVTVTEEDAARTVAPTSQTQVSPERAAKAGVGGDGKVSSETASRGASAVDAERRAQDGTPGKDSPTVELDADGWPWSADLHSATKTKTSKSLWRMKVGVKRPDPKPGFPHDL